MDRRTFITNTLALGAAGLAAPLLSNSSASQKDGIDKELSGVWNDPKLSQPSSITIESNFNGSEIKVAGTYVHKNYGQSDFQGIGKLKGNVVTINYAHENNPNLGNGTLRMELSKPGNKFILQGSCKREDGSWSAENMNWHKV